jgi:hypothetical protein
MQLNLSILRSEGTTKMDFCLRRLRLYLQQWRKNKLVYVQCAKAVIEIQ